MNDKNTGHEPAITAGGLEKSHDRACIPCHLPILAQFLGRYGGGAFIAILRESLIIGG